MVHKYANWDAPLGSLLNISLFLFPSRKKCVWDKIMMSK